MELTTIIGIVVAVAVVFFILICAIWCGLRYMQATHSRKTKRTMNIPLNPTTQAMSTGFQRNVELHSAEPVPVPSDEDRFYEEDAPLPPLPEDAVPINNKLRLPSIMMEDHWSLNYSDLQIGDVLGEGSYGIVYKATYKNQVVAVKQMKDLDPKQQESFLREAALMIKVKPHRNIIRLYGVCHEVNKPLAIVTEFCSKGSLKSLLQSGTKLSHHEIVQISKDIANGMLHLHHERIVHRDLSARNILVAIEDNTRVCKVADFGLSRITDRGEGVTESNVGPIRWMSPESLLEKKYSSMSDVWAYACTLFEVLTKGKDPYPEQPEPLLVAASVMLENARPTIPENTPLKLANILNACFEREPTRRPTFKQIISVLDEVENDIKENPFY